MAELIIILHIENDVLYIFLRHCIKGVTPGCFPQRPECTVTLGSNKLFSIREKELFEPIGLKGKGAEFLFFLKAFFEIPIFD